MGGTQANSREDCVARGRMIVNEAFSILIWTPLLKKGARTGGHVARRKVVAERRCPFSWLRTGRLTTPSTTAKMLVTGPCARRL